MKYVVLNQEFETFEEVNTWAWNEHFICPWEEPLTEAEKQEACKELAAHILTFDMDPAGGYGDRSHE